MGFAIHHDEQGIISYYYGVVGDDDLIACSAAKYCGDTDLSRCQYLLSDFADIVEFHVSSEGLRVSAEDAHAISARYPGLRMVGILPRDLEYGAGRIWQVIAENETSVIIIKRHTEQAIAWLRDNGVDIDLERYQAIRRRIQTALD